MTLSDHHRYERLLFWCVSLCLILLYLGSTTTWQSEDRWLEVVAEMLTSGDYFRPTLNHAAYFDKPLLTYWLVVGASYITCGLNEWALRLPSAIAAFITLWSVRDLGEKLWDAGVGRSAGWILLTCFGFITWARLGEADMENLAATTLAVCWYWRHRNAPTLRSYTIFYLIVVIGAQCKGLTAAIVPLLVISIDLAADKRWRSHINLAHLLALLGAASVYLLPFFIHRPDAAQSANQGLNAVLRENLTRYVAPFDHTEPPYTYLIALPQYLFPWSLLIGAALVTYVRSWRAQAPALHFVVKALLLIFVFFTLSGSRRNYYILPALPYCALIGAVYLQDLKAQRGVQRLLKVSLGLLILIFAVEVVTPTMLSLTKWHQGAPLPIELIKVSRMAGLIGLASTLMVWLSRARWRNWCPVATIAAATALFAGFLFAQQPVLDSYRTAAPFARAVAQATKGIKLEAIGVYRERPGGTLLYYSGLPRPFTVLNEPGSVQAFLSTPPYPKLFMAYNKYSAELPTLLQIKQPLVIEPQLGFEKGSDGKMRAWLIDRTTASTSAPIEAL